MEYQMSMEFLLDDQTINDLHLFDEKANSQSIFSFYNKTVTKGGEETLYKIMRSPLTDINKLRDRVEAIQFLQTKAPKLRITYLQFDFIDTYLKSNILLLNPLWVDGFFTYLSNKLKPNQDFYLITSGIQHLLSLFSMFTKVFDNQLLPAGLKQKVMQVLQLVQHPDFSKYIEPDYTLTYVGTIALDRLFREKHVDALKKAIQVVYELDALVAIAKTADHHKFAYPTYVHTQLPVLQIHHAYHPYIDEPVPNSISLEDKNLCFLTGPNMAGKSTFLKTVALLVYLAHVGFPVPATAMRTAVFYGVITTINLSDNLDLGYSHFYSEVTRVKQTALKLRDNTKLLVVFDELFRGTNVKDAYDASIAIIKALLEVKSSKIFISTHITEIAEELMHLPSIEFTCLKSTWKENKMMYTYKLENGISHERLGFQIVKNEGILEILSSIKKE